jgi:hypothetical protein
VNLRNLANSITSGVNPNVTVSLRRCTGYATSASGARGPTYADAVPITLQEQALTSDELKHLDSLNIQGTLANYWTNGSVAAVDRRTGVGGDLIVIDGVTWLVVHIFENWRRSGWCHFVARQQSDVSA